jgi:hypothetical protein
VRRHDDTDGFVGAVWSLAHRDVGGTCRAVAATSAWDVRAADLLKALDAATGSTGGRHQG